MRTLLVFGAKTFKVTVPDDAKITFGPFSPPPSKNVNGMRIEPWGEASKAGTLRIYDKSTGNPLAVFSNVNGFRDTSIGYAEQVAKEEGATIWKDDEKGYTREHKQSMQREWVEEPPVKLITPGRKVKK